MKVISRTAESELATVYIARNDSGRMVEFVESTQPPFSLSEKWVLIISTLFGCPVDCSFCDAGGKYRGRLSKEELLFQIDYPVMQRFPDRIIRTKKFKVQFSRMGEPSFNPAVLEVLEVLPGLYAWNQFIPSLSTIAPVGTEKFFDRLLEIKQRLFAETFQLQFSLHSTSLEQRNEWMPVKKWGFDEISAYGRKFYQPGGKKITLNFAVSENTVLQPSELARHFSPDIFLVKLTPVNPTYKAQSNRIVSAISRNGLTGDELASGILSEGFEVILSVGEFEENLIGSNCGQYLQSYLRFCEKLPEAYSYDLVSDPE